MLYDSCVDKNKNILLVEDNQGDARLIDMALKEMRYNIHLTVITDGAQAMEYLHKIAPYSSATTPDLILLDLNIPKKDGKKVLAEIKNDAHLKCIPVIILTGSQADDDVLQCYNLAANCYISKPIEIDNFIQKFNTLINFWLNVATLPPKKKAE